MTSPREPGMDRSEGAETTSLPLEGLKVLDVSLYAPGRWATMYLADLGADVICLERPRSKKRGFDMLESDTHFRWLWLQRNKRSITLDFKSEQGQKIYLELAKASDVIVESLRPGSLDRAGIGYEVVAELNPAIVYCAVSGFGQGSSISGVSGHEPNYQAIGGLLTFNGSSDGKPVLSTGLVGDLYGGAMQGLVGILAALQYKSATGEGQFIDVSIVDGVFTSVGAPLCQWLNADKADNWRPERPRRGEFRATGGHPGSRVYETKDSQYVVSSAVEPWSWRNFCDALGLPEVANAFDREEEWEEVARLFEENFRTKTRDEWVAISEREDLSISPVLEPRELIESDQIRERDMVVDIEYEPLGTVKQIGIPIKMSKTPGAIRGMPRYGEHTEQVLQELDYGADEIEVLRSRGVI